jgi:hypothetical protein
MPAANTHQAPHIQGKQQQSRVIATLEKRKAGSSRLP